MSRELNFRVWDGEKFYYADCKDLLNGYPAIDAPCFIDVLKFNQFTGLKDKNEKNIFEGDILKFSGHVFTRETEIKEVKFTDGCFGVGFLPLFNLYQNNMEVIGNIYQNPELLSPSTIGNTKPA